MNKNIAIGIAVIIFVVVVGAFFIFRGGGALDVSLFQEDEAELSSFNNDIELFSKDGAALDEIDQTFGDILDEGTVISIDEALDEAAIIKEASQADLSDTLDAFTSDEIILQELDQAFGEVLQ